MTGNLTIDSAHGETLGTMCVFVLFLIWLNHFLFTQITPSKTRNSIAPPTVVARTNPSSSRCGGPEQKSPQTEQTLQRPRSRKAPKPNKRFIDPDHEHPNQTNAAEIQKRRGGSGGLWPTLRSDGLEPCSASEGGILYSERDDNYAGSVTKIDLGENLGFSRRRQLFYNSLRFFVNALMLVTRRVEVLVKVNRKNTRKRTLYPCPLWNSFAEF